MQFAEQRHFGIHSRLHNSLMEAEAAATLEAADTGGAVLAVQSVRPAGHGTVLSGFVSARAVHLSLGVDVPRGYLKPNGAGFLHLTMDSKAAVFDREVLGFLVVHRPVYASELVDREANETYFASLRLTDLSHFREPVSIGPACCARCSRPIEAKRLAAVPTTKICLECRNKLEQGASA